MRIAILGAGFTGLVTALRLLQKGYEVIIFEKENYTGGLAVGFKRAGWQWSLEKAYHHWFTNDQSVLNLARELNFPVVIKRPSTDVFIQNQQIPFDSPRSILTFPFLPIIDRLRLGLTAAYLKFSPDYKQFENKKALSWIRQYMGEKATKLIWEPLFIGKFGDFKEEIALTWFWARVKKRTPSLAYPEGGYKLFVDRLVEEIKKMGGQIQLQTEVEKIASNQTGCQITASSKKYDFDKVIVTLPSPIFAKITSGLPDDYIKKIISIPHLNAQVMILVLKKPFLKPTYWLNITDKNFPFLVLVDHTNFMPSKYYNGEHLLYIGNYLPPNHPYLKMNKEQLLKKFDPFLKKISPDYKSGLIDKYLFVGLFAQPIVTVDYPKLIPDYKTPLKNIYLANLDMVYPWDRGTNYAVEMGEKVADEIS